MGLLQSYSAFLVKNPATVLLMSTSFVVILFMITAYLRPFQSFEDPLVGFEARNTEISIRINTWKLLNDETSASVNNLSIMPNSGHDLSYHFLGTNKQYNDLHHAENASEVDLELPVVEMSTQHTGKSTSTPVPNVLDEFEDEYYQMVNASHASTSSLIHHSIDSSQAFCGKLYEGYAQVVVSPAPAYSHTGLFNLNSMIAICQLDRRLRLENSIDDHAIFHRDCEQYNGKDPSKVGFACCKSWSLPNYIACLSNKTSCIHIEAKDIRNAEQSIKACAPFYYKVPYEECFTDNIDQNDQQASAKDWPASPSTASTSTLSPSIALLNPDTGHLEKARCGVIPDKCLKCGGWIYNVLHFLTNDNFIKNKPTLNLASNKSNPNAKPRVGKSTTKAHNGKELMISKLTYTNLFLPIAKSSSLMKYYNTLSRYNLKTPYAQVKVLNLGLKSSLFERLVSDDLRLFVIALISIMLVIAIYTWSFVLSFAILMIICLSLCLSYTIYELILGIPIFPFMNLLAVVISFGICSDNAMLFCKQWSLKQSISVDEPDGGNQTSSIRKLPQKIDKHQIDNICTGCSDYEMARVDGMLKRALMGTSAATFATACSFMISAISQVIAVRCFCIFATLSVTTNYLLIVLLLPPALILDMRFRKLLKRNLKQQKYSLALKIFSPLRGARARFLELGERVHQTYILDIVIRLKYYLIISFLAISICASILVFKKGLQPSDDDDIHLLTKKHEFEQYDRNLRMQFAFERSKKTHVINSKPFQDTPETLPIRIVFGVQAADNGNYYNPEDRGGLIYDPRFDFADANTQIWLLEFCHKLRHQRFVHHSSMIELSNCFIDTFKTWMEQRPCQDPVYGYDRSPCCQAFEFPFKGYIFERCINEALTIMRKTPHLYPNVNAGIRFYKNSTKIAVVIIEFSSNRFYTDSFTRMDRFYHEVNDWVTWHINNTAPPGLKSGWFISSNMELLALQSELDTSTSNSVLLEIVFATLALAMSTQNFILTISGTLTIGSIIMIVIASLILLKWTLGVAESILISLTVGLSIDFALHYSVAYSEGLKTRASYGVIHRILGEVGSPIALATVTTSLAGFVIVWSDILAYQELGIFLMLIAIVSWLTSTFFLLPILATIDAIREYGQLCSRQIMRVIFSMFIDRI